MLICGNVWVVCRNDLYVFGHGSNSEGSAQSAKRAWYYRMYKWRAKVWMRFCACAGWSESVHFALVRRHFFFAWRGLFVVVNVSKMWFVCLSAVVSVVFVCNNAAADVFAWYNVDTVWFVRLNVDRLLLSQQTKIWIVLLSGMWFFKCARAVSCLGNKHAPQGLYYMPATSKGSSETALMVACMISTPFNCAGLFVVYTVDEVGCGRFSSHTVCFVSRNGGIVRFVQCW